MPRKKKETTVQKAVFLHGIQVTDEMNETLIERLADRLEVLPTCKDYWAMLRYANARFGYPIENMRQLYGLATYARWAELLKIQLAL